MITEHVLAPSPPAFPPLVFVCLFVLRDLMGRRVFEEPTAITNKLNDWALLVHLSSPC